MTKTYCDQCGEKIDSTKLRKEWLLKTNYLKNNEDTAQLPFTFTIKVECMEFCTTNLHFCEECTLEAIYKRTKDLLDDVSTDVNQKHIN